ncbi:L,D-transpeptidase [Streptomyces sp. NPDC001262]|uniref:L,D-transpeptidase n=1 Tax=Streptomyces TaxID=1883 RepID=UPI0036AFB814
MARSSSGVIVAALTAAALAGVGFLAYQAEAAPDKPARHHAAAGKDKQSQQQGGKPAAGPQGGQQQAANAVPAASGTGMRVVYALAQKRVWLVGADGKASRTFDVAPSAVSPQPGTYTVTSRSANITGSDGIPVEHVVRFNAVNGVVFGFSAAVDGSSPNPNSGKKTGAIREKPADGRAMWEFAVSGTKVVVVP